MSSFLSLVGTFYIVKVILSWVAQLLYGFKTFILPKYVDNEKWIQSLGSWAVVTGCTRGIGLAYAKELAKRKINLILIARNPEYLKKVSSVLESRFKIETITIEAELSKTDSFEKIRRIVETKDIGILVNNVATSHMPMKFHLADDETLQSIVNCNILTLTLLTKMVLPCMIKKNKGAIVNVSSQSSLMPANLICAYSSSKAYINKFTETLSLDYRDTNIVFQCLNTGLVKTNSSVRGIGKPAKAADLDAVQYAASTIKTLGYSKHTGGHWSHGLQGLMLASIPKIILDSLLPSQLEKFLMSGNKDDSSYDDMDYILNSD